MKQIKLAKKQKRYLIIAAGVFCMAAVITFLLFIGNTKKNEQDTPEIVRDEESNAAGIEITADELQTYRENIGNDMDIKKSILIIFNNQTECQTFIDEHGADDNVLSLGKGIIPEMQGGDNGEKYFNVVGNSVFESLFDNMTDGECCREAIEFGGAFCYFKRIGRVSVTDNDEDLKELIKREKALRERGNAQ